MDTAVSQALATLITAISTAILMAAAYYWGPNRRAKRNGHNNDEGESDGE